MTWTIGSTCIYYRLGHLASEDAEAQAEQKALQFCKADSKAHLVLLRATWTIKASRHAQQSLCMQSLTIDEATANTQKLWLALCFLRVVNRTCITEDEVHLMAIYNHLGKSDKMSYEAKNGSHRLSENPLAYSTQKSHPDSSNKESSTGAPMNTSNKFLYVLPFATNVGVNNPSSQWSDATVGRWFSEVTDSYNTCCTVTPTLTSKGLDKESSDRVVGWKASISLCTNDGYRQHVFTTVMQIADRHEREKNLLAVKNAIFPIALKPRRENIMSKWGWGSFLFCESCIWTAPQSHEWR